MEKNGVKLAAELIAEESSEISIGQNLTWAKKILKAFPALEVRNYRLYFFGQLISLIGSWLQVVAQGWLMLQLTNSAFLLGLVAAVAALPTLILSLFSGVIIDHFSKKKIIIFTQTAAMVLAFVLGGLTISGLINIQEILILAFLSGVVGAIDNPARLAYVNELVGDKKFLASAIALNSGIFNTARVIGPSVAGILIALVGTGGAFILNGLSYIAVIVALFMINTPFKKADKKIETIKAIKEGLRYVSKHELVKTVLVYLAVLSIFGWSYTTVMPVIAKNVFHLGAAGLGYLYAANGLGALTAAILISGASHRFKPCNFILGGISLFSIALITFSFVSNLYLAFFLLFFIGFGLISISAISNTIVQSSVDDNYRGRVMSIYALVFSGLMPVGNLEVGFLAEKFSSAVAIRFGAMVVFLCGFFIYSRREKLTVC